MMRDASRWLLVLAIFLAGTAKADPDPILTSVLPADNLAGLVLAPDLPAPIPASVNVITVRNASNMPISGASVLVTLTAANVLCGSTVLTGTTNGAGQTTIVFGGGGCVHNVSLAGRIRVNGFTIRNFYSVKSPDFDGATGNGSVQLGDLIQFSKEFLDVAPNECHDYDNDTNTGLSDLIVFSPAFTNPNSCVP